MCGRIRSASASLTLTASAWRSAFSSARLIAALLAPPVTDLRSASLSRDQLVKLIADAADWLSYIEEG